jgi:hypothetical protein
LNRVLIGLIAANLCITLPLAFWLNIWADEAYSLMTSGKDFAHALHQSIYFEKNAPLYYLLLQVWRQIYDSIFFSRLLSILCISLTIYSSAFVSKRYLPQIYPAWISALIAFHPFSIWAAVEIRLYALSLLLSALLLLLFHDAYLETTPRPLAKGLFVGVATVAAYTFIPIIFLFTTLGLVLLIVRRQALRDYALAMCSVGIMALPLGFIIYERLTGLDAGATCPTPPGVNAFSLPVGLQTVGRSMLYFFLPLTGNHYHALPIYIRVVVVVLAVALLLLAIKNSRFGDRQHRIVWLLSITSSLVLSIGMAAAKTYGMKYTTIIFIPVLLAVLSALYLQLKTHRRVVVLYLVCIFMACCATLLTGYGAMAKQGDFNRVIAYINASERPNQPILVFAPGTATPLAYLYKGPNTVIALPEAERFDGPDNWCKYFLKNEQQILTALPTSAKSAPLIWLVTEHPGLAAIPEYKASFPVLDNFVDKYYQVESSQDFYGANVRVLRRKGNLSAISPGS